MLLEFTIKFTNDKVYIKVSSYYIKKKNKTQKFT